MRDMKGIPVRHDFNDIVLMRAPCSRQCSLQIAGFRHPSVGDTVRLAQRSNADILRRGPQSVEHFLWNSVRYRQKVENTSAAVVNDHNCDRRPHFATEKAQPIAVMQERNIPNQ